MFGGDILTATDIAVRAGKKDIGDASLVSAVSDELVVKAQYAMKRLLEVGQDHFSRAYFSSVRF